jgi:O-succinylbenzoate synthase
MVAGVDAWLGGMLETGVGRAGLLALGTLPGFTLPGDLSATGRWYVDDLTAPVDLLDGALPVPSGPGLGVVPDAGALARYSTRVDTITRS